jgi:single-strand DNA-binding protein
LGSSLNKVILIGNLTRDPETKNTPNSQVCHFGIAVNREWKEQKEVTFVDIEVWGKMADVCQRYLTKGRQVCVEGRLKLDQWETAEGQKRSKLKVVGENIQFLGGGQKKDGGDRGGDDGGGGSEWGRGDGGGQSAGTGYGRGGSGGAGGEADEIPF